MLLVDCEVDSDEIELSRVSSYGAKEDPCGRGSVASQRSREEHWRRLPRVRPLGDEEFEASIVSLSHESEETESHSESEKLDASPESS